VAKAFNVISRQCLRSQAGRPRKACLCCALLTMVSICKRRSGNDPDQDLML
jgi:hypothetical protein